MQLLPSYGEMVAFLLKNGLLKKGGRVLEQTDGAGSQYKCASALYSMSVISCKFGITYNRAISAPSHGKNVVDGMGAVDKHTLYRATKKNFKPADNEDKDSKLIAAEIIKDGTVTSMAAECRRILMNERDVNLGSDRKSLKREEKKKIRSRYWHVRGIDEEIETYRCKTVTVPAEVDAQFSEM